MVVLTVGGFEHIVVDDEDLERLSESIRRNHLIGSWSNQLPAHTEVEPVEQLARLRPDEPTAGHRVEWLEHVACLFQKWVPHVARVAESHVDPPISSVNPIVMATLLLVRRRRERSAKVF